MLASHQWLRELTGLDLTAQQMADAFTSGGLEVEGLHDKGTKLDRVVIAEVRSQRPHPARDNLTLVTVFDGATEQEIVCGAPNVPEAGRLVLLAQLGANLPNGVEIAERKLGGIVSCGMLCGETELDLGADDGGLLVLEPESGAKAGQLAVDALHLRDTVLEISVAPNRPDCLGHVGLARELCAVVGRRWSDLPKAQVEHVVSAGPGLWPQAESAFELFATQSERVETGVSVRVDIQDVERCSRYGAAIVDGVRVARSPFHVRYRLHVLGLRAISNVVDATNLILLGFGHPIHAFDLDRVAGHRIVVRRANDGETLRTLDGELRTLTSDDLVICDEERPLALAGVMGGAESEIGPNTRRVLIECAVFDARGVRRTSRRAALHTDASHRFERGVDRDDVRTVLAHASGMIAGLAHGRVVTDALDVQTRQHVPTAIDLRGTRLNALLGATIGLDEAQAILTRLGCTVVPAASGLRVVPATARIDLTREVDLIEEVARIRGYDKIPTRTPHIAPSTDGTLPSIRFVRRLREAAASVGLNEAVNYAFVAPNDLAKARVPTEAVVLANPMSEERSVLRTSLLPGLLADLGRAQRHQVDYFAQFEIARTFTPAGAGELPTERVELGILIGGEQTRWVGESRAVDAYDLKGFVEAIVVAVAGAVPTTLPAPELAARAAHMHPRRSAIIRMGGVQVGYLGELHPDVVAAHDLLGRPSFACMEVNALIEAASAIGLPRATPLPRFPASSRDLAVVVPEEQSAGAVAEVLRQAGGPLVEAVTLFDIYRGEPVAPGSKSLAFHVVYRDANETLTDKLVEKAHARVVEAATQRFGAKLRH